MSVLLNHTYNWINWVKLIDSWKPWPIIWISACTHWWEVVWIEIIEYLLNMLNLEKEIQKGKLYLILSNIEAYNKFRKWDYNNIENILNCRYIDENLNRCCDENNLNNSDSYEAKRAKELTQILKTLNYHFDIHSVMTQSPPMLLYTKKSFNILKNVFNTDLELIDITKVQVWKPLIDICERNWWYWIWIETWSQLDKSWYKVWLDNITRLLHFLWIVNKSFWANLLADNKEREKIKVLSSIMVKNNFFYTNRHFSNMEQIQKWEFIAFDWENKIFAPDNCFILFPKPKPFIWEEFCFLWKDI